jgi:hypothetical protein
MLPEREVAYLAEHWPDAQVSQDGGMVAVVLPQFPFPAGFAPDRADLMLRLPFGFPDAKPDMFWVEPFVTVRGAQPVASEVREVHLGKTWQRFSRHLADQDWRSGVDGLRSYVALINSMLRREAGGEQVAA